MTLQHKCPGCGADMVFDAEKGTLFCESCETTMDVEEYPIADFEEFETMTSASTFGEDGAAQYQCKNCGAILITDEDTAATSCSFCGAPMILSDRLSGQMAPAKVIPFKVSKEQAQAAFKKWCKGGLLTPKGFMSAERIKSITGMYVPFWLYDLYGSGETMADCTKVHTYSDNDYIYTQTKHFHVYRKVDLNFLKIPADASAKMNDTLMDKLEPFDYGELKDFQTPYLAGFIAEKYNYTDKDLFKRVKDRVEKYVAEYIDSTMHGYTTTVFTQKNIQIKQKNAVYALLPVWMICYDYDKAEHTFAMNGQTGKIVGKPPISLKRIFGLFGKSTAIIFAILELMTILGGGL